MKISKLIVTASVVIGTTVVALNSAEARRNTVSEYACSAPSSQFTYIYPVADWEPFFRRRFYRYGPILICDSPSHPTTVISVRY